MLYTLNNISIVLEIIVSKYSCILKRMSRNTFPEPQPDSASYATLVVWSESWEFFAFAKTGQCCPIINRLSPCYLHPFNKSTICNPFILHCHNFWHNNWTKKLNWIRRLALNRFVTNYFTSTSSQESLKIILSSNN